MVLHASFPPFKMSNDFFTSVDLRFPFSVFVEGRSLKNYKPDIVGSVSDVQDKSIGRNVFKMQGSVSANNYVEFSSLQLTGDNLYVQLSLQGSKVATMHFELMTTDDLPLRVSASTLFDAPRFLGRSLRLPLPKRELENGEWVTIHFPWSKIFSMYCHKGPASPLDRKSSSGTQSLRAAYHFLYVKKIQLCSTMAVRDVVTSDQPIQFDKVRSRRQLH